ncbi:MAG TPA: peptidylprolyl isomerase [Paracoccaceae bacterium]|nr:peptidylprolyl isomerase [Paracoccaceae bacterium]
MRLPFPAPFQALATALCLLATALILPAPVLAQGLFSPRATVNGQAVTTFEFEQRLLMLTLFGTPGDREAEALEGLIDDRLRKGAADALGIAVTPEQIMAGMEEFASRANLTAEEFTAALNGAGVATETFRDFVESGLLWREVVRARFLPRVTISAAEIDRALARGEGQSDAARVLLSEIVLPAPAGTEGRALTLAQNIRAETQGEEAFATAARRYSAAPTATRGGTLNWTPTEALPPAVASAVTGLAPGQVSQPVRLDGVVALFLLRGIERGGAASAVEYAQFFLPEGPQALAEAERIRDRVDTCDDLYGVARGLPPERLVRETLPIAQVPQDIGMELARLDANEVSTALVRGGARVVLMLCGRDLQAIESISRDAVREQLLNQRLSSLADGLLEELRADAIITQP